jgi:hypothetical protein
LYSSTYKLKAAGKWGELEYEFAPPVINGTFDDLFQVDAWQAEIYDYHGTPVYLFSWNDFRNMTANYGMIYNGEIYLSDAFPITNDYPCEHDVYGSANSFDGFGSLAWGVKAAGVSVIDQMEE